jgi:hypothetical protein
MPDPSGRHELRYWDGTQWSEHVSDRGETATDPLQIDYPAPVEAPPLATAMPAAGGYPQSRRSGKAIASLVLGIVGLIVFGVIMGALAIIFGVMALSDIKRDPGLGGRGMAQAGLITGIIGFLGGVALIVYLLATQ